MHRIADHENCEAPCNVYCDPPYHVDLIYVEPERAAKYGDDMRTIQKAFPHAQGRYVIHAVAPALEAPPIRHYYKVYWGHAVEADNYIAYRVTYTIHRPPLVAR